MPTDRHTATGTCEIGQSALKLFRHEVQAVCCGSRANPHRMRHGTASVASLQARLMRARSAGRERLDLAGGANEARHDDEADQEENRLEHVAAGATQPEQAGEHPAARERRAEHFGADQDRRAHHREHVHPDDSPPPPVFHGLFHAASFGALACAEAKRRQSGPIRRSDQGCKQREPHARFSLRPANPGFAGFGHFIMVQVGNIRLGRAVGRVARCEAPSRVGPLPTASRGEGKPRVAKSSWLAISHHLAMPLHASGYRRGIVVAPHQAAAEAGRLILAEGGNALEAMVAMAATIAAVYPHMNHIGGDGFWLVREPKGRVRAIMGAGRAGSRARRELYREAGHETIPARGPLAALTVPCAVAGWMLALELARSLGAKLPLEVLLGSAIRHARDGYA